MTSVRRFLLLSLLSAILMAGVLGALATYQITLKEADDIFDYHLYQVALSLSNQDFSGGLPPYTEAEGTQFDLVIQVWDQTGVRLYLSHPHIHLPGFAQLGHATVSTEEGSWRVFSMSSHNRVIQVAQPTEVRAALAADMAVRVLLPYLIIIPLLGTLVWWAISRGLRPVEKLARVVSSRNPETLDPLPSGDMPVELVPLVSALNGLLARLRESLDTLHAFVADAAHELRTPLAALHLQAQLIQRSRNADERQHAIERLQAGLKRATHVVEQLLTLARQEGDLAGKDFTLVDLKQLAAQAVNELQSIALDKQIDLGMKLDTGELTARGDKAALHILLSNLLDNALRYTPPGGRVTLDIGREDGSLLLAVSDTGPGIPQAERQRVFDRFYRGENANVPGSGLGLAIVQRIAQRHAARVSLHDGNTGRGLVVRVELPSDSGETAGHPGFAG